MVVKGPFLKVVSFSTEQTLHIYVTQYFFFIQAFEQVDNSIWQKNYSKLLKCE